tara:strand:+ start:39 stop:1193 length:1155 start_codon:yes stop_codon:yes gene_type:complete
MATPLTTEQKKAEKQRIQKAMALYEYQQRSGGSLSDGKSSFTVNSNGSITAPLSAGGTKTFNLEDSKQFDEMLQNLVTYNVGNLVPIETLNIDGLDQDPEKNLIVDKNLDGKPDAPKEVSDVAVKSLVGDATVDDAKKRIFKTDQARNKALTLGLPAAAGGIEALYKAFGTTAQDEYVEKELAALKKKRSEGQMGLTASEKSAQMSNEMDPVRALAREERLRRESSMSASGAMTSAADLQRAADTEAVAITEAGRNAGASLNKSQTAAVAADMLRLEEMTAYKSARKQERNDALFQGLADAGTVAGKIAGGSVVNTRANKAAGIFDMADMQGVELTGVELANISTQLGGASLTEEKIKRVLKQYKIDYDELTTAQKNSLSQETT